MHTVLCMYVAMREHIDLFIPVAQRGETAMLFASWEGHVAIVAALLQQGADVHTQNMVRNHTTCSILIACQHYCV